MQETWCAGCGAHVEHDPWSAHHVLLDDLSTIGQCFALVIAIDGVLRRLHGILQRPALKPARTMPSIAVVTDRPGG